MPRFQFSLKTLLILIVVLCIALGLRHIWQTQFASYLIADSPTANQPLRIHGQFFDRDGPDSQVFPVWVSPKERPRRHYCITKVFAKRTGWGTYRFSAETSAPLPQPIRPVECALVADPIDYGWVTGQFVLDP